MILGLGIAFLIIILDQLSKYWVMNVLLSEFVLINYTSFFNLVRAWNTGVSFSMFNNYGALGAIVLSLVAMAIVAMLIYWLKNEKNKLLQVSLGLIIGGAIGNVIDRVRFGAVFDFLDFSYNGYHWPAFNLADSTICVGATIIIAHSVVDFVKIKIKEIKSKKNKGE